jgi:16S rRNA pseudouridine516 synthase
MLKDERRPVLAREIEVDGDAVVVAIGEGLYHQVRRMFAAVGNHVETLERIAIGPVVLDRTLGEGGWRFLTDEEVAALS